MLRRAAVLTAGAAALAVVAACGGSHPPAVLKTAPEPGVAPVPTVTPAGTVLPLGVPDTEGIVVDGASRYAVLATRSPDRLVVVDLRTRGVTTVPAAGAARHLELAGPESVIVPGEDTRIVAVQAIPSGQVLSEVHTPKQPHDAVLLPSGVLVNADEGADSVTASRGDQVLGTISGPVQPGGVARSGQYAAVVAVRGRLLYVVQGEPLEIVGTVPVGEGPTHVVDLGDGTVAVADTTGGRILVVRVSTKPKVVATVDVPGQPYGLAVDLARHRLWVASSGTDVVHELQLGAAGSAPREVASYPTVQQPNSLAVVPATGQVLVAAAVTPAQLQEITP